MRLTFVDEFNISNISIDEPNIVISESNVNDINNGHTTKKTVLRIRKHEKSPVAPTVTLNPIPADKLYNSYDKPDTGNKLPRFTPNR